MMKPWKLITITVICLLGACNNNNNRAPNDQSEIDHNAEIKVNLADFTQYLVDSLPINEVKYLKLETSEECLIGQVSKFRMKNEKIYILDDRYAKALFVFDIEGNFLFKLGMKGKGPHECTNLTYFDLDQDGNIYLHDQGARRILKFDVNGKYLKDFRFPFFASSFLVINDNLFVLYTGTHAEHNHLKVSGLNDRMILFWKPNTNEIIKSFFPFQGKIVENYGGWHDNFFKSNKNLYYIPSFKDEIYQISESGVKCNYIYSFGEDSRISLEEMKNLKDHREREEYRKKGKLGSHIRNFHETKNHISFVFTRLGRMDKYIYVQSKSTGNIKIHEMISVMKSKTKANFLEQIDQCAVDENYFIKVLEGGTLSSLIKVVKANDKWYYNKWGHLEGYEILKTMDEGSNPLIILYNFKDF